MSLLAFGKSIAAVLNDAMDRLQMGVSIIHRLQTGFVVSKKYYSSTNNSPALWHNIADTP